MEEKAKFIVTNSKGEKIPYYIIATYNDENTKKDYIVYTDGKLNSEKKLNVYYSLYKEINDSIKLIDIVNPGDKKIALGVLKSVLEDLK